MFGQAAGKCSIPVPVASEDTPPKLELASPGRIGCSPVLVENRSSRWYKEATRLSQLQVRTSTKVRFLTSTKVELMSSDEIRIVLIAKTQRRIPRT